MRKITVWSAVENNKTRFGTGRAPKGAGIVGEFERLYDPNTGEMSDHYSYQPRNFAQQPSGAWLYYKTPLVRQT